jgi:endo-1,4-beta-D-glucanase Y
MIGGEGKGREGRWGERTGAGPINEAHSHSLTPTHNRPPNKPTHKTKHADFFAWQCSLAGQKMDATPAPDGEIWFATALIFAHTRWTSQDRYDYEGEALKLLKALADTRRGMFNDQGGVTLNPVQPTITNPSYHVPHFYEVWVRFLKDRGEEKAAAFYLAAAEYSRGLLRK